MRTDEKGQTTVLLALTLSIFLLAFAGLATDYTNFWFHRQKLQTAADAACQAGAMDLLLTSWQSTDPRGQATTSATSYGQLNDAAATISTTFPASCGLLPAPAPGTVPYPCMTVDATEQVPAYFSFLLTGNRTTTVHARANCGLTAPLSPPPILVLNPTVSGALQTNGSAGIAIQGGPVQSIQVNSGNVSAEIFNGSGLIDLTQGGPNGTGGHFGTWGGSNTQPSNILPVGNGTYIQPSTPISDPYQNIAAPSTSGLANCPGRNCVTHAAYKINGCPDPSGCDEYAPGNYTGGIDVSGVTAIFDPGLYYVTGSMTLKSGSNVRTSTAVGDGSGGVMFYLTGGTITVNANSGKGNGAGNEYHTDGSLSPNGVPSRAMECSGVSACDPKNHWCPYIPPTIDGNVLLGPCTGTYASPSGRGFVFFQDRSAAAQTDWGGNGSLLVAGLMYFHQCNASGTGVGCSTAAYGSQFYMHGTPGSTSWMVGSLVTDTILLKGNPGLNMVLTPQTSFPELKVALVP